MGEAFAHAAGKRAAQGSWLRSGQTDGSYLAARAGVIGGDMFVVPLGRPYDLAPRFLVSEPVA